MREDRKKALLAIALSGLAVSLSLVAALWDGSAAELNSMLSRFVTTEWMPFRVAVRSSYDGRVLRVLDHSDHGGRPIDVVASHDGATVYFSRFRRVVCADGTRNEMPEILRVPIAGGPIEPLEPSARGFNLAITPDGSALTYNSDASGTGCGGGEGGRLVRRDLNSGETRTLIDPERDGLDMTLQHSWTPDGSRLLAHGSLTVDGIPRLFRVDFVAGGVRATPLKDNHDFPSGVAVSDDTYAASYLDENGYHVASFEFDGTFRRIMFDYDAAFEPRVDPSRRHYLYVRQGQGREPSTLVRWNAVIGRRVLGTAFVQDVNWVPHPARR